MKLGLTFNIPFRFVNPGKYKFKNSEYDVEVSIELAQNLETARNVAGWTISGSEGSSVDYNADVHGLFNFSKVRMKLEKNNDCNLSCLIEQYTIGMESHVDLVLKEISIKVINRLIEVVRISTNNYWLRFINLRDIHDFRIFDISQNPPMFHLGMDFSHGFMFPNIEVKDQNFMNAKIITDLENNIPTPTWKNLFLDAINFFTMERFNEAILIVNVALEAFTAQYVLKKLKEISANDDEAWERMKRLPKSMKKMYEKHFHLIDGRKFKEGNEIWLKLINVREMRTSAAHSFTRKMTLNEAYKVILDTKDILEWVDPEISLSKIVQVKEDANESKPQSQP